MPTKSLANCVGIIVILEASVLRPECPDGSFRNSGGEPLTTVDQRLSPDPFRFLFLLISFFFSFIFSSFPSYPSLSLCLSLFTFILLLQLRWIDALHVSSRNFRGGFFVLLEHRSSPKFLPSFDPVSVMSTGSLRKLRGQIFHAYTPSIVLKAGAAFEAFLIGPRARDNRLEYLRAPLRTDSLVYQFFRYVFVEYIIWFELYHFDRYFFTF